MSSSRGVSEGSDRPSRRFPTPGYGALFVIIVLCITALLSSCYGADNNPRLIINGPISGDASSESLLYPARETRWTSNSALPALGSPSEVYQVVPFESGKDSATNALKSFVKLFSEVKGTALSKVTDSALSMIDNTSSAIVSLSPTLAGSNDLAKVAGEDSAAKTWQQALNGFVSAQSNASPKTKVEAVKRKVDLRGWSLTEVNRRKNSVVLSFENEEEASLFLKQYQASKQS